MNLVQKALVVVFAIVAAFAVMVVGMALAQANGGHTLVVDGTTYQPTLVVGNGPTVHYYTPGTTPSVAYTERHVWTGHGSENLPCDGRLHWIDNSNVLTISHCESDNGGGGGTTTTTVADTTTTSSPEDTTTTTTRPSTTTTVVSPTTSTTLVGSTTTSTVGASTTSTLILCGKGGDAPCGGVATGGGSEADTLAQEAPGPIPICGRSGAGWIVAGGMLLLLAIIVLLAWTAYKASTSWQAGE